MARQKKKDRILREREELGMNVGGERSHGKSDTWSREEVTEAHNRMQIKRHRLI